jgi:hypothetical protein
MGAAGAGAARPRATPRTDATENTKQLNQKPVRDFMMI